MYHEFWFKRLLANVAKNHETLNYLPGCIRTVYNMGAQYRVLINHYIVCRLDVVETALTLHVSEKQVRRMLNKIHSVSGIKMDDISEIFELQAGMMMLHSTMGKECKDYLK